MTQSIKLGRIWILVSLLATLAFGAPAQAGRCARALQVARFDHPIEVLNEFLAPEKLKPAKIDQTIDEIAEKDARGALFRVEGLLRVYSKLDEEVFEDHLNKIKQAEDSIGAYTEKLDYVAFAQKAGAQKSAVRELEKEARQARLKLKTDLPKLAKNIKALEAEVLEYDWKSPDKDAVKVAKAVVKELKKMEPLDYDMNELQDGVHELRRKLRWFLIYVQAFDGLIVTQKSTGPLKLNEYRYLETHPIAESRFSQVPRNPRVKNPIPLPFSYFLGLSKIVTELGEVKSFGENVEELSRALYESGSSPTRSKAEAKAWKLAEKAPGYTEDVAESARHVKKELKRTKLLKRIRLALEEFIENAGE